MEGSCEEGCLLEGVTIRQHYWHYGIGGSRQVILNGFQAKRLNILSPQAGATDAVGLKLVGATWSLESATIRGIAGQTRLALLSGRNVIGKNIHIEDADCGIEISQNFFGNLTGTAGGGEWPTITLEGIDAIFLPGPAVRISHPGAFVTLTNVTIRGSAPLAETVDDVDRGKISQGINAGGHEVTPFYSRPGSGGTIITNDPALV